MAELLLELLSEEIPARMQDRAREELARGIRDLLAKSLLVPENTDVEIVASFATPRRLTVVAQNLREMRPFVQIEQDGASN